MDLQLNEKVVFIAGASRGIGLAIARAFIHEGAKVAITARGEETLQSAYAALLAEGTDKQSLFSFAGDMTKSAVIARAMDETEKRLGPIHCAVANVGLAQAPFGFDVSDEDWEADTTQNLFSAVYLAREASRRILSRPDAERAGANIVFISSISGMNALGGDLIRAKLTYTAAKAGINLVARELAKMVSHQALRVNVVAPGNIMFEGGVWDTAVKAYPDRIGSWINREVPMKRFGKSEEIADAVIFLASGRASFITGATLVVDGGQVR